VKKLNRYLFGIFGKEVRYVIQLNYRDSKPIYEQIKEGLRKLVITGVIARDEKLPSVRELAAELVINPNTIQRAYRELEQEGYIYTISGKGSFAAEQSDVNGRRNEELLQQFDEIVRELLYLSEDKESLIQRIEEISKGGKRQ
jgi:GntR family transcriptional regulator